MTRLAFFAMFLLLAACAQVAAEVPVYGYKIVHAYPHDTGAFTEGLFWHDGHMYESTGEVGRSSIRQVDLATGEVTRINHLKPPYYGEGIIALDGKLYQLTWKAGKGFIYSFPGLKKTGSFDYEGQGWGMTTDGTSLYMSDGTPVIRVLNPKTLKVTRRIEITLNGRKLRRINELEWVDGKLWANIWLTMALVRIDPATGKVDRIVNLDGLQPAPGETVDPANAVANGIAWDAEGKRLFVTGKHWPHLYQIELVPPES